MTLSDSKDMKTISFKFKDSGSFLCFNLSLTIDPFVNWNFNVAESIEGCGWRIETLFSQ